MSLWEGHLENIDNDVMRFSQSFDIDKRMYKEDIECSIAHVKMLGKQKIIENSEEIVFELRKILSDIESGNLKLDLLCEDVHTFIEETLTKRLGNVGKRIHTARSRNDQIAVDLKFYIKKQIKEISHLICILIETISDIAEKNIDVVMPSYTHLQRAQPSSFSHHILAYAFMFKRDLIRLKNCLENMDECPLGACACAGTTYPIDRFYVSNELGFSKPTDNSIDSVSDRDFALELLSDFAIIMMHLSRFSEEIILWSSWEFKFVSLSDSYCTGSSIMPQKKNPDMAELIRGKTGKVYGNLFAILTIMKGLPLSYNRDIQEDKEQIFESINTVKDCFIIFERMIQTMKVNQENMEKSLKEGFVNATDCADYLTRKGMPFRDAYKITGNIVNFCISKNITLDKLNLQDYKKFSNLFEEDIFNAINLKNCVRNRKSYGGPEKSSILNQIKIINLFIKEYQIC